MIVGMVVSRGEVARRDPPPAPSLEQVGHRKVKAA